MKVYELFRLSLNAVIGYSFKTASQNIHYLNFINYTNNEGNISEEQVNVSLGIRINI